MRISWVHHKLSEFKPGQSSLTKSSNIRVRNYEKFFFFFFPHNTYSSCKMKLFCHFTYIKLSTLTTQIEPNSTSYDMKEFFNGKSRFKDSIRPIS